MQKFKVEVFREVTRTYRQLGEVIIEAEDGDEVYRLFIEEDFEELTKNAKWEDEEETEKAITDYGAEDINEE